MSFYSDVMKKKEENKTLETSEKRGFVCDILRIRLGIELKPDSVLVRRIANEIGSQWDDTPMPVAATDLPDLVEEYYHKFR